MNCLKKYLSNVLCRFGRSKPFIEMMQPTREDWLDQMHRLIQINLSTMAMHQKTFLPFKGVNTGKDVVVVASGPTAKDYSVIPRCAHIGVNQTYLLTAIKFDYYFAHDNHLGQHLKAINNYRPGECVKFYGLVEEYYYDDATGTISEADAIAAGALRYRTDIRKHDFGICKFARDLSTEPLGDFGSIVYSAMQFALWTNPRRIYLVGCDCSNVGHFCDGKGADYAYMIRPWHLLKKFAHRYYPMTEIVSINPVNLRGLFVDWDQAKGDPMP